MCRRGKVTTAVGPAKVSYSYGAACAGSVAAATQNTIDVRAFADITAYLPTLNII